MVSQCTRSGRLLTAVDFIADGGVWNTQVIRTIPIVVELACTHSARDIVQVVKALRQNVVCIEVRRVREKLLIGHALIRPIATTGR